MIDFSNIVIVGVPVRMDEFLQLEKYHPILFIQYIKYLHLSILDLLIRLHDSIG